MDSLGSSLAVILKSPAVYAILLFKHFTSLERFFELFQLDVRALRFHFDLERTVIDDVLDNFEFILENLLTDKPMMVVVCFLITCLWEYFNSLTVLSRQKAPRKCIIAWSGHQFVV